MTLLLTVIHRQWEKPDPLVPRVLPSPVRNGLLALIDWDAKAIIWSQPFDSAAGACFADDMVFVASMAGHRVAAFDRTLRQRGHLLNPLFNDLHTVRRSNRGLLITASGTDSIIEVNNDGVPCWTWLASEHGFNHLIDGSEHIVDRRFDYSTAPPMTGSQTTHINSAIEHNGVVLATLFVQGALIAINKTTGSFKRVVNGMNRPHAIRQRPKGWTLCDSGGSRVVLLGGSFEIEDTIEAGFNWPQDAVSVGHNGESVIVLDANNARIIEMDVGSHAVVGEVGFPPSWKGFSIEIVPDDWVPTLYRGGVRGALERGD